MYVGRVAIPYPSAPPPLWPAVCPLSWRPSMCSTHHQQIARSVLQHGRSAVATYWVVSVLHCPCRWLVWRLASSEVREAWLGGVLTLCAPRLRRARSECSMTIRQSVLTVPEGEGKAHKTPSFGGNPRTHSTYLAECWTTTPPSGPCVRALRAPERDMSVSWN